MIPGIKSAPPTKEEAQAFHESERNCNTCRFLKRVDQPKQLSGLYDGVCTFIAGPVKHPYPCSMSDCGVGIKFSPDDHMDMLCYSSRWAKQ